MKTLLAFLLLIPGVLSAQTPLWAGKTAAQGNTFLSPYTGTWNGSLITGTYGGTGVNNGASTITLGGNLTTSGAFPVTFTLTASTNVTLPTSGTLVNSAVGTLSSLTSIGTIATGVWNATVIGPTYGGTGIGNPTAHTVPVAEGSSNMTFLSPSTAGFVLTSNGTGSDPSFQAPSGLLVSAITADQTAATGTLYINNKATTQLSLTLPATAAVGSEIEVVGGSDAAGWKIVGIAGTIFHSDATTGVTGTGAYISTANQYAVVKIICIVANTEWEVESSSGSITLN
ncbi:MAG: hypothetical protein KGJ13_05780 [Patescibacteria group bacterium]|nr:hypothetical protein [Patescibacteria group bacterium]